ncbi:mRNA decay activator protein ZFP36L1-like [Microcaecilia unicolor]|uniref:mRNA decay activator protein ZFP36 n=1 Tax=Microcaecilia unicolor TaxID=1415580 RepID=A0A6P7ZDV1_9AMPH|nr:mRNA decay activator protein ZFP36L1-like [Microcaecilia unicolor]
MPSDLLSPFLELDLDLSENFLSLSVLEEPGSKRKTPGAPRGALQRTHSARLASIEQLGSSSSSFWPVHSPWSQAAKLPRSSLLHRIPFQVDRSVSMIEGPSLSTGSCYKTELCRSFQESDACNFATHCQFACGLQEQRNVNHQAKYQKMPFYGFQTPSYCPYGAHGHFFHTAEAQQPEALVQSYSPNRTDRISCCPSETLFHSCMEPSVYCSTETLHHSCTQPGSSSSSSLSPLHPSPICPDGTFSCSKDPLDSQGIFTAALCGSFLRRTQTSNALQAPADRSTLLPGLQRQRSHSWDSLFDRDGYSSCDSESPDPGVGGRWLPVFSRTS